MEFKTKITSFVPRHPSKEAHLNIVMPNRHFKDLRELKVYATSLMQVIANPQQFQTHAGLNTEHFNPSEPFLLLFPETPFPREYVPSRNEAKATARSLAAMLKKIHPASRIAYSLNEKTLFNSKMTVARHPVHSNTGYFIRDGKYSATPKIIRSLGDNLTMTSFAAHAAGPDEVEVLRLQGASTMAWGRRAAKYKKTDNPFANEVFSSGHQVEHRVCLDWFHQTPPDQNLITAISAHGLDAKTIGKLAGERSAVVINDPAAFGFQLAFEGNAIKLYPNQTENAQEIDRLLTEQKLKIHLVD